MKQFNKTANRMLSKAYHTYGVYIAEKIQRNGNDYLDTFRKNCRAAVIKAADNIIKLIPIKPPS